jgi:hypothetical protein
MVDVRMVDCHPLSKILNKPVGALSCLLRRSGPNSLDKCPPQHDGMLSWRGHVEPSPRHVMETGYGDVRRSGERNGNISNERIAI